MNRIRSGDAEIAYASFGDGPPILLLHPFPADHEFWLSSSEVLESRYRILLPDLRAHGESEAGEGPATMEKHALDLVRVLDDAHVGRAIFAGSSIGGYILFEFWRRFRHRIERLVLCGTRAQADSAETRAARLASIDDVQRRGPSAFLDAQAERLVGPTARRNRPDLAAEARAM